MNLKSCAFFCAFALVFFSSSADDRSAPALHPIFRDGMVFAAGKPMRVYGSGAGAVKVSFRGVTRTAKGGADGWRVDLPAVAPGGAETLTVELDGKKTELRDIRVGEVFLMAGQSNMGETLASQKIDRSGWKDDPLLRCYTANYPDQPNRSKEGWKTFVASEANGWGAIIALFGRERRAAGVPAYGAVGCYQGASCIESWLPEERTAPFAALPKEKLFGDHFAAHYPWNKPGTLYHGTFRTIGPFSFTGVVWYQGESNTGSREEAEVYGKVLPEFIRTWRRDLDDPTLKFLVVQLADFDCRMRGEPWPGIQAAQAAIADRIDGAVCVRASDLCPPKDIHPQGKDRLARRLSRTWDAVREPRGLQTFASAWRMMNYGLRGDSESDLAAYYRVTGDRNAAKGLAADVADPRVRTFVYPTRIVAHAKPDGTVSYAPRFNIQRLERLFEPKLGQVPERHDGPKEGTTLVYGGDGQRPWILLDFGRELHGGIHLGMSGWTSRQAKLRVRFGESVGEAMCDLGEKGATNDHALRDFELAVPAYGSIEVGNTGFRFVRLDLLTPGKVGFDFIRAVELMRPMKAVGAFKSSDPRLNLVFDTAVRTVHLCCQDYLWDGIKRDRLVWLGDSHPEFKTVLAVFGADPVLESTLRYARATTDPEKRWMNDMPSYTLCYLRDERELYWADGDRARLEANRDYLVKTVKKVCSCMTTNNTWEAGGWAFLDWPSQKDKAGTKAGLNGAAALALADAADLMDVLGEKNLAAECRANVRKLRLFRGNPGDCKQAGALLALGGIREPKEMFATCLGRHGYAGVSTFYGYYMLEAMSAAGETQRALDTVRDYWGAMNDMGATSYWEDFNLAWTNNATRLDVMPVAGKKDIHGDFGDFCYSGYRHSFCHGWASGPAAWCIEHVLGLKIAAPGGTVVTFKPELGDLAWAEGALALPGGRAVRVRVERRPDGSYAKRVDAPPGVTVSPR